MWGIHSSAALRRAVDRPNEHCSMNFEAPETVRKLAPGQCSAARATVVEGACPIVAERLWSRSVAEPRRDSQVPQCTER